MRAEGTMEGVNVPSSFQDENLLGTFPDTSCLANFRLSLPGRLFADARAQIFFQTGEGPGKGGMVLPVREIGKVIFADDFRQLVAPKSDEGGKFAGVRVQALPFFQRRAISQRGGKKVALLLRKLTSLTSTSLYSLPACSILAKYIHGFLDQDLRHHSAVM